METLTEDIDTLVLEAQRGDRDAFGRIVEIYHGLVERTARRQVWDQHDADELVQEVFLHAMLMIGQLREAARLPGWLKTITVRLAINRGQRKRPLPTMDEQTLEGRLAGGTATPIESLMRGEEHQIVREAVDGLRDIDRDVLVAFYFEEKSIEQIVDEFNIPEGTAKRRLHVGRNRLREMIEGSSDRRATLRRLLAEPKSNSADSQSMTPKVRAGRRVRRHSRAQAKRRQLVGSG